MLSLLFTSPIAVVFPEQHDIYLENDGSLSVYAQMNGIRYINIEAERAYQGKGDDHLPMQIKMLNYTLSRQ
jgi:hypothetical protein